MLTITNSKHSYKIKRLVFSDALIFWKRFMGFPVSMLNVQMMKLKNSFENTFRKWNASQMVIRLSDKASRVAMFRHSRVSIRHADDNNIPYMKPVCILKLKRKLKTILWQHLQSSFLNLYDVLRKKIKSKKPNAGVALQCKGTKKNWIRLQKLLQAGDIKICNLLAIFIKAWTAIFIYIMDCFFAISIWCVLIMFKCLFSSSSYFFSTNVMMIDFVLSKIIFISNILLSSNRLWTGFLYVVHGRGFIAIYKLWCNCSAKFQCFQKTLF